MVLQSPLLIRPPLSLSVTVSVPSPSPRASGLLGPGSQITPPLRSCSCGWGPEGWWCYCWNFSVWEWCHLFCLLLSLTMFCTCEDAKYRPPLFLSAHSVISGHLGGEKYTIDKFWLWPFGSLKILKVRFLRLWGSLVQGLRASSGTWDLVTHSVVYLSKSLWTLHPWVF